MVILIGNGSEILICVEMESGTLRQNVNVIWMLSVVESVILNGNVTCGGDADETWIVTLILNGNSCVCDP